MRLRRYRPVALVLLALHLTACMSYCAIELFAAPHERSELLCDALDFFRVGVVGVFEHCKLFLVRKITGIDSDLLDVLRGDHRGIRGEVNVGDQRNVNLSPIEFLSNTVASNAMVMPTMLYQLPRLAVSWLESPPRARMKSIVAAMYETVTMPALIMSPSLAKHFEHATCDGETAGDVDAGY